MRSSAMARRLTATVRLQAPAKEEPSMYPEPKQRELSETEKAQIRERIQQGDDNIYKLAQEFACSSSQIAGIKAALHR